MHFVKLYFLCKSKPFQVEVDFYVSGTIIFCGRVEIVVFVRQKQKNRSLHAKNSK